MDPNFVQTLYITFKLAVWTTLLLLILGIPFAAWLSETKSRLKPVIEAIVCMPMVLPPSVTGYYLLIVYSPQNGIGKWLAQTFDLRLAFSFEGILIASILFSLPFMIQPLHNGLKSLPPSLKEASYVLGKSKIKTFFTVLLPNSKSSVITAIALTFAHTIGEFGVVLMVGGNLPGKTRVASIAIYDEAQALNFQKANAYALVLFITALILLTTIYSVNNKKEPWKII